MHYRAAVGGSAEKLGQAAWQSGRGHRTLNGRSPRANIGSDDVPSEILGLATRPKWRRTIGAAFSGSMRRFRRDPSAAPHDTDSRPGARIRESADHRCFIGLCQGSDVIVPNSSESPAAIRSTSARASAGSRGASGQNSAGPAQCCHVSSRFTCAPDLVWMSTASTSSRTSMDRASFPSSLRLRLSRDRPA
jgi:hypothetical protein